MKIISDEKTKTFCIIRNLDLNQIAEDIIEKTNIKLNSFSKIKIELNKEREEKYLGFKYELSENNIILSSGEYNINSKIKILIYFIHIA